MCGWGIKGRIFFLASTSYLHPIPWEIPSEPLTCSPLNYLASFENLWKDADHQSVFLWTQAWDSRAGASHKVLGLWSLSLTSRDKRKADPLRFIRIRERTHTYTRNGYFCIFVEFGIFEGYPGFSYWKMIPHIFHVKGDMVGSGQRQGHLFNGYFKKLFLNRDRVEDCNIQMKEMWIHNFTL